jgi:hypothetical protein
LALPLTSTRPKLLSAIEQRGATEINHSSIFDSAIDRGAAERQIAPGSICISPAFAILTDTLSVPPDNLSPANVI